jgi:hypothetical protein
MDANILNAHTDVFEEFESLFGVELSFFEKDFSLFGGFDFDKDKFIEYLCSTYSYDRRRDGNIQTFLKEWFGKKSIKIIKIIEGNHENDSILTY